jgi:hypothetical protein
MTGSQCANAAPIAQSIDLDRPWQGFIAVSQQPMIDLQKQLANSP